MGRAGSGSIAAIVFVLVVSTFAWVSVKKPSPSVLPLPLPPTQVFPSGENAREPSSSPPIEFLGVVLARSAADIAPRVEGKLKDVYVRLGDHVTSGQAIAAIDAPTLRYELRVAEANLMAMDAEQNRAVVELSEADERLARRNALATDALVTREELATVRYQQQVATTHVASLRAQSAERRAQVDRLRKDNADVILRAPFNGIVAARYMDPGSSVSSSTPIVRVISADDVFVRFAVSEQQASTIATGQQVNVRVGDRPLALRGIIDKIAPEIDAAARMVFVEANLAPIAPDSPILSGEIVRVSADRAH